MDRSFHTALQAGKVCYSPELVARGVCFLVVAEHEIEARAAGEVDEDVYEGPTVAVAGTMHNPPLLHHNASSVSFPRLTHLPSCPRSDVSTTGYHATMVRHKSLN